MSYQEKRNIVSMLSGAAILAAYCLVAWGRYRSGAIGPDDLAAWAGLMLVFIGIGIVASIVIQIVFHILLSVSIAVEKKIQDENCAEGEIERTIKNEMVEDEMGKLIELKAARAGYILAGTGFVAALLSLVLKAAPAVMLNIVFLSMSAASLAEGFVQLYFYRKGLAHG
jgi:hypothetical protein